MIPQQETLQTWHWNLPDPVSRRVNIIATDVAQDDVSRDRAA
jgi:electron transport complex protein RnfB